MKYSCLFKSLQQALDSLVCVWFMLQTGLGFTESKQTVHFLPNIWILKKNTVREEVMGINLGSALWRQELKTLLEKEAFTSFGNGNAASALSPLASFHDSLHPNCWNINTRAKWGFGIWQLRNSREYHLSDVLLQPLKPWQPLWYGLVFAKLHITASCWDAFPAINTDSRTEGRTAHIPRLFWCGSTSTSSCQLSLFLLCVTWYLLFEAFEASCGPNRP